MKEINWDEAPEGFPVWIEASGDIGSGWHRDVGDRYEDQDGSFWSKPEEGFYTVYSKSEGNLMQKKFAIGDKVRVCVGWYVGIPKGTILSVVADGTLGAYWIAGGYAEVGTVNVYHGEFELVDAARESNETPSLVQKTTPKNDDTGERDSQLRVDNNAWFERGELPPIGSKVVFYSDDFENEDYWNKDLTNESEVDVIAHIASSVKQAEADLAVFVFQCPNGDYQVEQALPCCFRPIKTAEEIEAEGREKAIEELRSSVGEKLGIKPCSALQWRVAEAIYDLGYRKMEKTND